MTFPEILKTALAFLLVIGPLIFIHELGHYLVGRWCGVKAEAFSIGFGRELFAWVDKRGTRWRVAALPLGGYVRFKGDMNAASMADPAWLEMPAKDRMESFPAQPVWKRAAIVAAGPLVNFLAAILLLGGLGWWVGEATAPPVVGFVAPQSAAEKAGLKVGDRIVSIIGRDIHEFTDISRIVVLRPNEALDYRIERGGRTIDMAIAAGTRYEGDRFGNRYALGLLGIAPPSRPVIREVSFAEIPVVGARRSWKVLVDTYDGLGQIITGRRSVKEMGGPLRMAQISGEVIDNGLLPFIGLAAFISINLGFINLLPIPTLDGGHLLFYGIEAVQRRPVSPQVQEWAYRGGLALLLTVMVMVTFNDLSSFGIWRGLTGLIG